MFTYLFRHEDGQQREFVVKKAQTVDLERHPWAALDFHQCPSCPLSKADTPHCPPAADLIEIVEAFSDTPSTESVEVQVRGADREYTRRCDAQTGLRSLIGLVMARSSCPRLAPLRAMAVMHLPFASRAETTYRVASAYLLRQYFERKAARPIDLELNGLREFYGELRSINIHFARRLRAASRRDASVNAVAALASLSNLVTFSLDDDLEDLRTLLDNDPRE